MQTVLVTLHGEQLGSIVPAPDGVIPHADIAHHITVRTNDYFGSRSISNMYFMGPLLNDGKEVLGYYIVESSSSDDLVFKLEDMSLKRKEPGFIEDPGTAPHLRRYPTLEAAVRLRFFNKICQEVVFICASCAHVQKGGGAVTSELHTQESGVYILSVPCYNCGTVNTLREERGYAELFILLQEAVGETNPQQVDRFEPEGE